MPNLTFVLPHWLYWSGLVIFPLVAMFLVRRQRAAAPPAEALQSIAYLLLLTSGFVGIHRLYLRSKLGFAYVPLFAAILFGNARAREARNIVSDLRNELAGADFMLERAQKAVDKGTDGAMAKLSDAQQALTTAQEGMAAAVAQFDQWGTFSTAFGVAILVFLLVDAFLLPRLTRRAAALDRQKGVIHADAVLEEAPDPYGQGYVEGKPRPAISRYIDRLNGWVGHFIAFWAVIAVYVYYYEVLARYVFNSPTNWAHESMFLMFGMQYLLAGAFAYREDAHVRVDVLYEYLSERTKVITDLITSIFFFIFTVTLLATGWIFFSDSFAVLEVSFTEWAIQYWPVKAAIFVGAVLIILQGISKLAADITALARQGT
jgi:TRAP-type mannitol/chloroaromatic compound transport system permease small subunit